MGLPTALRSAPALDSEDNFSQILAADGEVLFSTLPADSGPAIGAEATASAVRGDLLLPELDVAGVDGGARVLAGPAPSGRRTLVAVSGTANQGPGRDALADCRRLRGRGAARPVARRRRRLPACPPGAIARRVHAGSGQRISGEGGGERLPVPAADDELRALAVTLNSLLERLEQALDREKNFVSRRQPRAADAVRRF